MNIVIHPSKLNGTINAIPSKSYAHRFLICASFSDKPSDLMISSSSKDIDATINCLRGIGARISCDKDKYHVIPVNFDNLVDMPKIDCGESGSTLRFITPIVCALKGATIKTHGRLPNRPMGDLINCLSSSGIQIDKQDDTYSISGRLNSNKFEIAGNVSSQYITGLLLMLPLIGGGEIRLTTKLESSSYVDITIDVMRKFGIDINYTNNTFYVSKGGYIASNSVVPGDWSNGTFWITSRLRVGNLDLSSCQGDKSVLKVIENMGCSIDIEDDLLLVSGHISKDSNIDVGDIPDSVPALCIFAAKSKYKTSFTNALRLKDKESDRIKTCLDMLHAFGVEAFETSDGFSVIGKGSLFNTCVIDCAGDHRIAMAAATACNNLSGDIELVGAECVEKSYPKFWDDFVSLGGKIDVKYDR